MSVVRKLSLLIALVGGLLAGCNSVPPTNVHQPMTARPAPRPDAQYANGSIFNAATSRPLFEDRRARNVGDILTITLAENTSAAVKSNDAIKRESSVTASYPTMMGVPGKTFLGTNLDVGSTNSFTGKGESTNSNVLTGTITVTVIEVMANGNLLVSGEKQVAVSQGQEYIRLSGVVDPRFIAANNTISSTRVADARVEYKESGQFADAQVMGWLARFFLTVLPF